MKAVFTYVRGAWKFYALVRTDEQLKGQLDHLTSQQEEYKVVPVDSSDFNNIQDIEDSLNA